jgi:NDP-sugar pyrophosphorylase family protein
METKVKIIDSKRFGYGFVAGTFLRDGEDEYFLRDIQAKASSRRFRHLEPEEIRILEGNLNKCRNWSDVLVSDPFDPTLIRNSEFFGLVRLGKMAERVVCFHDFSVPVGISNSRIVSCDIGDDCALFDCSFLSHYVIDRNVILYRIGEMVATNHAKFGNGILKEGEDPSVRVSIDIMNEAGGRAVYPFSDIRCSDAWLWATYRDDKPLMERFVEMTDKTCDQRRGRYGFVGEQSVIKSCDTIKDVWVGPGAYIKGANKLKNLTLRSTLEEPVQLGEGIELVNGIVGAGSRVFYGCKAIRFVMGDNCNLKYGARLIHSILGDNSTVSCCEMLSNLVFPGHEQHHNNSFLIASLIKGQSNMAAGANIGSNHNSRGNDGELVAGRGFWPALSSTLKYDCRFASYVLIAKGNYPYELDIPLPFSLLGANNKEDRRVVMPAYWWMYNLYALERNSYKYRKRDRRKVIRQHIETDYLAPDTAQEIVAARKLLQKWTAESWNRRAGDRTPYGEERLLEQGRVLLEERQSWLAGLAVTSDVLENSSVPVEILKPAEAYRAYTDMLCYYGTKAVAEWCAAGHLSVSAFQQTVSESYGRWLNLGGQLVPEQKVEELKDRIREGSLETWDAVHGVYEEWHAQYRRDKAIDGLSVLKDVLKVPALDERTWTSLVEQVVATRSYIEGQVFKTKEKDFDNRFRHTTYRNGAERDAVLGCLDDNPFIRDSREISRSIVGTVRSVPF